MNATRRAQRAGTKPTEGPSTAKPSAAEERIQQMLSGVRAAGLKLTPQRVAIVRALAGDPTHPTAQEIFDRLQSSMPTMSFATVYNTLDALTNAGLCGSLSLSPGPARFDPNMAAHHHAVCDGCGLVRDVPCDVPGEDVLRPAPPAEDARSKGVPALAGFEVRAVEHIYRGLCAACATSGNRSASTGSPEPSLTRPYCPTRKENHNGQPQRNQDPSEPQGRLRG